MKSHTQSALRLYHYPRCGTSRTVLEALQAKGYGVEIYLYLEKPLALEKVRELVRKSAQSAHYLLREKEALVQELALLRADEESVIKAIAEYPILLNRPVIESAEKVFVCRPAQQLEMILAQL